MPNKEKFYRGSLFTTLKELENRCATNETTGTPKELIKLELGKQNQNDGTIGTYEQPSDNPNLGLLIFEEFDPKNKEETNLLVTGHELKKEKELFRGEAQIGDKQRDVIVFRREED